MYERRTKRSSTAAAVAQLHLHHRFASKTLGQESTKTNPSRSSTTSITHALQPRACHAETVRSQTRRDDYDSIFYSEWLKVSIEPTRFIDPDVICLLGIRSDLEDMFVELGMGDMATNPQVLYPGLVCLFIATVQVYYDHERARRASEGILTFFI